MTAEEVLRVHRTIFYGSLINQDFEALADLYANEYMLVRSDGSVLNKEAVLHDLKLGGLIFKSIELSHSWVSNDLRVLLVSEIWPKKETPAIDYSYVAHPKVPARLR
jgi:hypothetical protein